MVGQLLLAILWCLVASAIWKQSHGFGSDSGFIVNASPRNSLPFNYMFLYSPNEFCNAALTILVHFNKIDQGH